MKIFLKKFFLLFLLIFILGLSIPLMSAHAQSPSSVYNSVGNLVSEANGVPTDKGDGSCWVGFWDGGIDVGNCLAQGGYYIIAIINKILVLVGLLFDFIILNTLIHMSTNIKAIDGIQVGWVALRDLSNIVIIFVLLYISIATILRLSGYQAKDLLVKVIIVALLINFSLFFTKVIIDVANTFSTVFYNKISVTVQPDGQHVSGGKGLAEAFMGPFNLQTIANPARNNLDVTAANDTDPARAFARSPNPLPLFVMGSIFMLIAIFVFVAASVLFVIRFVVLVILMVFSPLAFAGSILPKTKTYADKWWTALFSEAFFAPLFMIMIWLSLKIINGTGFTALTGTNTANGTAANSFNQAFTNPSAGTSAIILNFVIVIVFLVSSLIIAKQLGAHGGATAMKTFDFLKKKTQRGVGAATFGATGLGMRYGFGRAAQTYVNSDKGKADQRSTGLVAKTRFAVGQQLAKSSFDARGAASALGMATKGAGKGGYEQIQKKRQEKIVEQNKKQGQMTGEELAVFNKLATTKSDKEAEQHEMLKPEVKANQPFLQRRAIESTVKEHETEIEKTEKEIVLQQTNFDTADHNNDEQAKEAAAKAKAAAIAEKSKLMNSLETIKNDPDNKKLMRDTDKLDQRFTELAKDIKAADDGMKKQKAAAASAGRVRQSEFLKEKERPSVYNLGIPPKKEVQQIRADMAKSPHDRATDILQDGIKQLVKLGTKTERETKEMSQNIKDIEDQGKTGH